MDYQNKEYDEVVKQESLDKYKSQTNNEAKSVENAPEVIVSQRFSVRITRTVDEKLSRALHGRAGTGSQPRTVILHRLTGPKKITASPDRVRPLAGTKTIHCDLLWQKGSGRLGRERGQAEQPYGSHLRLRGFGGGGREQGGGQRLGCEVVQARQGWIWPQLPGSGGRPSVWGLFPAGRRGGAA